jgi:hypothetical protein
VTTPLAPYANLRLLIPQPVTAANFRTGVPISTINWVIECFAKRDQSRADDNPAGKLPSLEAFSQILEGYITSWAVLAPNANWLAARSTFNWNETGLAPVGLLPGTSGIAIYTELSLLPTITMPAQQGEIQIVGLSNPYGTGGIGAEVRSVLGDKIRMEIQTIG